MPDSVAHDAQDYPHTENVRDIDDTHDNAYQMTYDGLNNLRRRAQLRFIANKTNQQCKTAGQNIQSPPCVHCALCSVCIQWLCQRKNNNKLIASWAEQERTRKKWKNKYKLHTISVRCDLFFAFLIPFSVCRCCCHCHWSISHANHFNLYTRSVSVCRFTYRTDHQCNANDDSIRVETRERETEDGIYRERRRFYKMANIQYSLTIDAFVVLMHKLWNTHTHNELQLNIYYMYIRWRISTSFTSYSSFPVDVDVMNWHGRTKWWIWATTTPTTTTG